MLDVVDLTAAEALVAVFVIVIAGYVRGLTGFALSAVVVAGMSFALDPVEAVPLAVSFEIGASILQGPSISRAVHWRRLAILLVGAVIGNPIGVAILTNAHAGVLRPVTYGTLLVLTVALLVLTRQVVAASDSAFFVVGIVAGVVNGATALSGLVLVLAMSAMAIAAIEMRSTLIAYFFATDLALITYLFARGDADGTTLKRVVIGLPLLAAGILLGTRGFHRTTPEAFRRITLGILIVVSLVGLGRAAF